MVATGSYLPGEPISNEELESFAGGLPEDVLEGLQVKTRHWIADPRTGEQGETNAEMAARRPSRRSSWRISTPERSSCW